MMHLIFCFVQPTSEELSAIFKETMLLGFQPLLDPEVRTHMYTDWPKSTWNTFAHISLSQMRCRYLYWSPIAYISNGREKNIPKETDREMCVYIYIHSTCTSLSLCTGMTDCYCCRHTGLKRPCWLVYMDLEYESYWSFYWWIAGVYQGTSV